MTKAPKSSKWNTSYGKLTEESALLALQFVTATFLNAPAKLRQKPTKQDLEEKLEMCAMPSLVFMPSGVLISCCSFGA